MSFEHLKDIDVQRIVKDIKTLSHENFQGRQAGTVGGQKSADFVIRRFEHLGILPAGEAQEGMERSWVQQRPLSATVVSDEVTANFTVIRQSRQPYDVNLRLKADFLPVLDSPSVNVTAPVVFVGYGIDDPARGINDYQGLNVRNRIVLFLRGKPTSYSRWVTHEEKEQTARKHGAAGFITLTGPLLNRYEARRGLANIPLAMYSAAPDTRPLPGIWISGNVGDTLFTSQELSLNDIQTRLNEGKPVPVQDLGIVAHWRWQSQKTSGKLINILGTLPGQDPVLRKEIILIGAHRDHFGKQAGLVFAGADDNASGTALLLELARLLEAHKTDLKRTIVFAAFDGEERGLLGSKLYVQNPTHPLHNIFTMINIDHVGAGNGKLTVGLTRIPQSMGARAADQAGLSERVSLYGYFPGGDHVPFYEAGVPTVTVVSSGTHAHFHQPSDTGDTIQPAVLERAARYALALTWMFATGHKDDWFEESSSSDSRS
ncbi:MAG: M28 family peptidase [Nitrospirales bacterium]|nr:M28 family peptidase [Nitrospira sp.]MDR4501439.1 M28 family peptidase [Nitrospirales bacterium]